MPYVAPSTVTSGQTYTAAAHNVIVNDVIDHETRIVAATTTANAASAAVNAANPTGSIIEFIGSGVATPSGYLVCNGQAVSRTTYANLFALIGTTYGIGNGTTTFNLPNIPSETQTGFQLDPIQPIATIQNPNVLLAVASPTFDNKIYVGAQNSIFQRQGALSGFARFNEDGTYDTTFAATVNNTVRALLFDSSNNLYAFGDFTLANGSSRNRAAKWATGGSSLDSTWNPDLNNAVTCCAIQSDGKILIGGYFTTVGGASQSYLARLNVSGTRDTSFAPTIVGSNLNSIVVQPDGNILIGGTFTSVNGTARTNIARLTSTGTLDTTFQTGINNGSVNALARQSNGQILIGGSFTSWTGATVPNDFGYVARVSSTGTLDETYKPLFSQTVLSVAIGSDNSHYYGGQFLSVGGFAVPYIAKLSSSGVVDRDWCPAPNGSIYSVSFDGQGRILIGGQHVHIGRPGGTTFANFGSIASWGWNRLLPTTQKTIALIKT